MYAPFKRRRAVQRVLLSLSIVVVLVGASFTVPAPASGRSLAPVAAPNGPVWAVSWNITASGSVTEQKGDRSVSIKRYIAISGSATVREGEDGFMVAEPFYLTVRDEREERRRLGTSLTIDREKIIDSGRYNGGPDPYWYHPYDFEPERTDDGKWMFPLRLFSTPFFINGDLARHFTYRGDYYDDQDGWREPFFTDMLNYSVVMPNQPMADGQFAGLPGNADGSGFALDTTYIAHEHIATPLELQVQFHAQVHGLGGCAGKPAPIDVDDPVLENHPLDLTVDADTPEITPDGTANLRAFLTCEGQPIKNAPLQVTSNPYDFSGYHEHNEGRPNGYINGVKLAPGASPAPVTLKTDERGMVKIAFQPGKDTKNERIGIAGTYMILVRSKELDVVELTPIDVRLRGLLPLSQSPSNIEVDPGSVTRDHPWNSYGTPATLAAVQGMANDFEALQKLANEIRVSQGQAAWPVAPLNVNDISLPWGGLFDVRGWDSQAGRVRGAAWQPPHYTHTDGTVVDFSTKRLKAYFPPELKPQASKILRAMLRAIGTRYGSWVGGPTMTLKVQQGLATMAQAEANGPDAGVVAFLADAEAETNPSAAPEQTVDMTLGVYNLETSMEGKPVTLAATLPRGLSFGSATPPPTRIDGSQIIWEMNGLPAQALPHLFDIHARIDTGVEAGTTLTVTTRLDSDADTNPSNNQDAFDLVVRPLGADLAVHSDLDTVAQTVEGPVSFSVDVANNGTTTADQTTLNLVLPEGVAVRGSTPGATREDGELKWALGALAPNTARTLTVTVDLDPTLAPPLDPDQPAPTLAYELNASATNEFAPDDNQLTIVRPVVRMGADVQVGLNVVGASSGTVTPGQELTYHVAYGNYGHQTAASTAISVTLGAGLELVEAQPVAGAVEAGTMRWNLQDLAPGEAGMLTLRVRVNQVPQAGSTVLVTASSATADLQPANNTVYDVRTTAPATPPPTTTYRVFLPLVRR